MFNLNGSYVFILINFFRMECEGCENKLFDFIRFLENEEATMEWLNKHNVVPKERHCPTCCKPLRKENKTLVCRRVIIEEENGRQRKTRCSYAVSHLKNTWFSGSRLSVKKIMELTITWLIMPAPRTSFIKDEFEVSTNTLVNWANYCREVCIQWCNRVTEPIGGEGVIIEIINVKRSVNKVCQRYVTEGLCCFGGFAKETKKLFIIPISDHTAETLLDVSISIYNFA